MHDEDISVNKQNLISLIYYADTASKILKENGYPGKAKALEDRYLRVAKEIGLVS